MPASRSHANRTNNETADREHVFTRVYDAPLEMVFDVWTNPVHVPHWVGGDGFTTTVHEMDVKPGGVWRFTMHAPDGKDYHNKAVYLEVDKPHRLVYKHIPEPGIESVAAEVSVSYEDDGGKTRVTVRILYPTVEQKEWMSKNRGADQAPKQSLDRVAAQLAKLQADRELVFHRVFDAPAALVFAVWTNPAHLAQWWGPYGFTTTVKEMDVRPGGTWRLTMHGPDGRDYHNRIIFLEVDKPRRLVYKHEPEPGSEPVNFEVTVTFDSDGPRTRLTMRMLFDSAKDRAYLVNTYHADEGGRQTLARLAAHLAGMADANKHIVFKRVIDAPRDLVFAAWTDPKHLAEWWGPEGFTNPVCEVDARSGGRILIQMRSPEGFEYPMHGSFTEIVEPERIVFLSGVDRPESGLQFEIRNTVTLVEAGPRRTELTLEVE
ncbi:MAG TPA: SRPBCC domain-containing protein, partial [Bryobacteraceae bacterium]